MANQIIYIYRRRGPYTQSHDIVALIIISLKGIRRRSTNLLSHSHISLISFFFAKETGFRNRLEKRERLIILKIMQFP